MTCASLSLFESLESRRLMSVTPTDALTFSDPRTLESGVASGRIGSIAVDPSDPSAVGILLPTRILPPDRR